ncbi:MAG: flagellar biosynthesis protein FlhF [Planctomycetes bacterium]|nr:flagellar biosynthesis protein FlhF [Planctomycetota bacterium]
MDGNRADLKTYQAYSMAHALAAVKRDLGPDAVILNTRSYKRGGILGIGSRTVFELTATVGAAPANRLFPSSARPRRAASGAAARAYAATTTTDDTAPTDFERLKTRRLAQALQVQHERRQQAAPAPAAVPTITAPADPAPVPVATVPPAEAAEKTDVARRFLLTPVAAAAATNEVATATAERRAITAPITAPPVRPSDLASRIPAGPVREPVLAGGADVHDELIAIRQMVGTVLQNHVPTRGRSSAAMMPQALFEMYLKLVGQEMSEEMADQIVDAVRAELDDDALEDSERVRAAVRRHLADLVLVADEAIPERSGDGRPLTVALVGPTGVGKTTTLAKLAATFKLRHGRKVGLVTADTYRIAAVDQLRTYADIIGLPLSVALTPEEMGRAVESLADCDVILIDTAGRSQNDENRLEELGAFIEVADPHEVHLVLSSTAGERVLLREAEAFGAVGVDKVVLTKLDEAVSFGMLVDVVRRIGKELSFMTNGQEVPDHIEVVRGDRFAGLVLGETSPQ